MPTPIPIIAASVGEEVPKVRLAAAIPRMLIPASTLTSAVASGRTAPRTLPKMSSKTISATANPTSSDFRSVAFGLVSWSSPPPYCTWMPASRMADVAVSSWLT
jgi:hypothetical protein